MRTDLIIRLGRIYDPEGAGHESCTLVRCLELIRDNQNFFTDDAIKARLTEEYRRSNADYLTFHRPDLKRIDEDLDQIITSRKPLIKLRHKVYAHKDLQTVLFGTSDVLLSKHEEVKDLIKLAHKIWNRYSQIWNASTFAGMTIGGDDYKWLLENLRRGMKVKSALQNRQFDRWSKRLKKATLIPLAQLNSLSHDEFVCIVGPVFEHSPWIAEATWPKRPFASVEELHQALCEAVRVAGEEKQLALIRAHPDLVGELALAGQLTKESTREQANVRLDKLSREEVALFQSNNAAYQAKFGFPFVICARLNKKEAILKGFKVRLQNSREQEIETALAEIGKIARLRLADIVSGT